MILEIQQPVVPDGIFYYTLSTLLGGALIWIIGRYVNKTSDLLNQLVQNDIRQDVTLIHHAKEIEELKEAK